MTCLVINKVGDVFIAPVGKNIFFGWKLKIVNLEDNFSVALVGEKMVTAAAAVEVIDKDFSVKFDKDKWTVKWEWLEFSYWTACY